MAARPITMRKLKEVMRLKFQAHLSHRQIARSLGVSSGTVSTYARKMIEAGLSWPLPADVDDTALEARVFDAPVSRGRAVVKREPEFPTIHQELKRKGVTLQLLWEEYQDGLPVEVAYSYSQFCVRYRTWRGQLKRSMRQVHRAGEKVFVDYAGPTVEVIDSRTGEVRQAAIFVAVLGASSYTYAEATWTQTLPDWCGSHARAFEFFGGVPELVVPDNLRSAVSKACRYEPDLNPTYAQMAAYFGVAVLPARPRKPKDKAKAEVGVQIVERWILARLRHHTFFSLSELNAAMAKLLNDLNQRPFKRLPGSRCEAFERLDRGALQPLPASPYLYTEVKKAKVYIDYHIELDGHYYSVPHNLVGKHVETHASASAVVVLHRGQRAAAHPRSWHRGGFTTLAEHMPKAHRKHAQWWQVETPGRFKTEHGRTISDNGWMRPPAAKSAHHWARDRVHASAQQAICPHPEHGSGQLVSGLTQPAQIVPRGGLAAEHSHAGSRRRRTS